MTQNYRKDSNEKEPNFLVRWLCRLILLAIVLIGGHFCYYLFLQMSGAFQKPKPYGESSKETLHIAEVAKERDPSLNKMVSLSDELSDRIARHKDLPERSPLGMGWLSESQASNGASMAQLMETLTIELGSSEILGTIRTLRENQLQAKELFAQTRSTDPEVAEAARAQLESFQKEEKTLELRTKELLDNEGMSFSENEIHSLCVSPNAEDTLILISAFGSIKKISQEMESRLKRFPSLIQSQRYYGSYCVLLMALDKIQKEGMRRIKEDHIPNAQQIEQETRETIENAQKLLAQQGTEFGPSSAEIRALTNNLQTCQKTIEISRRTQNKLMQNLDILQRANQKLQTSIEAAKNSHLTVMLQKEITTLEETHLQEITYLQGLTIPELAAVNFADPEHPKVYGAQKPTPEVTARY